MYEIKAQSGGLLLKKFEHRAPVLDVCFGKNDEVAYSAGLDYDVKRSVCISHCKRQVQPS